MHEHFNNNLVKAALKDVAVWLHVPFKQVKKLFVAGDYDVTLLFWKYFYAKNPYRTKGVNYCYSCKKFLLEFYEPRVPWSLEKDLEDHSTLH